MLDLLEILVDLVAGAVDALEILSLWRFLLCAIAAIALAVFTYHHLPNHTLGATLAALEVMVGGALGVLWQVAP